jgi:hypothetical protein
MRAESLLRHGRHPRSHLPVAAVGRRRRLGRRTERAVRAGARTVSAAGPDAGTWTGCRLGGRAGVVTGQTLSAADTLALRARLERRLARAAGAADRRYPTAASHVRGFPSPTGRGPSAALFTDRRRSEQPSESRLEVPRATTVGARGETEVHAPRALSADSSHHVHAGVTIAYEQEQPALAGGAVARRALGFGGAVVLRARLDVVPVAHHPPAHPVGLDMNG